MWCYVDESWQKNEDEHLGVLAAIVGPEDIFEKLNRQLFHLRKKYYGIEHARDMTRELKGTSLLSNSSFKMQEKHGFSKNLAIAHEVFAWVPLHAPGLKLISISVYGDKKPPLLAPDPKKLSRPFKELCVRINSAIPKGKRCQLVFDQRVSAQEGIAVAVVNYLAGMKENTRMRKCPLMGVSNTIGGLQLADMAAYVMGKYNSGDDRFLRYYKMLSVFQLHAEFEIRSLHGFVRLQWDGNNDYIIRKNRQKK
ncbi:DUF3800 domain-containing protein [Verrucomicrobia bacterium S94]|nr:DUF3800 domain-containing protein [Verrucomicrobia bacterium S94]